MKKKMFRWPPSLLEELETLVPERERSAFVRRAVERALANRRRQMERQALQSAGE